MKWPSFIVLHNVNGVTIQLTIELWALKRLFTTFEGKPPKLHLNFQEYPHLGLNTEKFSQEFFSVKPSISFNLYFLVQLLMELSRFAASFCVSKCSKYTSTTGRLFLKDFAPKRLLLLCSATLRFMFLVIPVYSESSEHLTIYKYQLITNCNVLSLNKLKITIKCLHLKRLF